MRPSSAAVALPKATNHTLALIPAAPRGIARTWREQRDPPWRYPKAGVVTTDLVHLAASQRAVIRRLDRERSMRLMGAMDACNVCWGRGSVVLARAGLERQRGGWATKFEMRTPSYSTRVEELPTARS
ncbi:hypothetical protein B2G69_03800 [Methylorubrum zatmanii]|nr:hypothetical protein B2G69_03800 [Methylorubrum zatmanii]